VNELAMLRTRIELTFSSPAVIMVTSAKRNDGSTVAALGLAECLAAAGHRVALLADDAEAALADNDERPQFALHRFADKLEPGCRSSDAVTAMAGSMRAAYDFTIVDALPLVESSVSMLLASTLEAVLLAVRLGRSGCPEDQLMMNALKLTEARVLGVVGASAASVREFDRRVRIGAARGNSRDKRSHALATLESRTATRS
jgi:Mrp family chromosome partitioning ATPase